MDTGVLFVACVYLFLFSYFKYPRVPLRYAGDDNGITSTARGTLVGAGGQSNATQEPGSDSRRTTRDVHIP
jgi:hypothetical protein